MISIISLTLTKPRLFFNLDLRGGTPEKVDCFCNFLMVLEGNDNGILPIGAPDQKPLIWVILKGNGKHLEIIYLECFLKIYILSRNQRAWG